MSIAIDIRIQIVLLMAKFESPRTVRRTLQVEFGPNTPSEDTIKRTFERFCETGNVEDRPRSGRPVTITEEKIDDVRNVCEAEPCSSVRSVAIACAIPQTTTHRIMTGHLSLKPFKSQFVQKIYDEDMQDRVEMCRILIPMLEDNDTREDVFFSDEATFHLNGSVNKHNVRYWCETNPNVTIETVMHSPKLNVWCALSKNRLIGPFFFDDDTVNGESYLAMLKSFFIPEVRKLKKVRAIIFQQDGAPPHFATDVRQFLDQQFPNRWIGRGGPVRWAPRSPDLTPLDFFLWVHVKNQVYKTPVKNMSDLKERIINEIKSISKVTSKNVFSTILKRMNLCISVDGDHFEHLL